MRLKEKPPVDERNRAMFVDSIEIESFEVTGANEITCSGASLEKKYQFTDDGEITVKYRWSSVFPFSTEISTTRELEITSTPSAKQSVMPIETVAKSERGFDRTVQGQAVTLEWDGSLGGAEVRIRPY
jgi:hypothetical protein